MKIKNYINGELTAPEKGGFLDDFEPATGKLYAQCPDSSDGDLERAIDSAESAYSDWSNMPAEQRSNIMSKLAALIDENADALAKAEAIDNGKPTKCRDPEDCGNRIKGHRGPKPECGRQSRNHSAQQR